MPMESPRKRKPRKPASDEISKASSAGEASAKTLVVAEPVTKASQGEEALRQSASVVQATDNTSKMNSGQPSIPGPLSPSEEYTWATLAHLSVLLNLITGMLGPVAALIVYLVYKDRSRYVAYQSMQAFIFQLIWWIGGGVLVGLAWTITGILTAVCIGLCLFPTAILISLIPIAALVYGVIGAVQCNQGANFRYWLIGDWVEGMLKN
jgi:uncharacterized Tic20 family protein